MIRRLLRFVGGGLAAAWFVDRWLAGLRVDDGDRPIRDPIRTSVEVDAPIDRTWALLVDIERQPEWMTEMKAVRVLGDGPVAVGMRGEATVRIFGIGVTDPVEVTEFSPPHRFSIRHDGAFHGAGEITLDTLDGGRRTRVVWAETLVPPILPNLGTRLLGPILERIFQADLQRFAALVESDGALSGPGVDPHAVDPPAADGTPVDGAAGAPAVDTGPARRDEAGFSRPIAVGPARADEAPADRA